MLCFIERFVPFNKIVFSIVLQFLITRANSESGWLKVCNPELYSSYQNYEVGAENCPKGVWLPEASSLGCICVNGLWVLTNDWCDENYQLVYGHGHCFHVENQVRKISYLGSTENAFEPKDFIANTQAHVFHALNGSKSLSDDTRFFDKGITILRINPQSDLRLKWVTQQKGVADSVCLKGLEKGNSEEGSESVTIFTLSTPADDIKIEDECTDNAESSEYISKNVIGLKPGKLISVKNGKIVDSSDQCYSTCESLTSHERVKRGSKSHRHKGRSGIIGRGATKTKAPKIKRILLDLPETNNNISRTLFPQKGNCSDTVIGLKDANLTVDEKSQIVNEETRRALKIELNKILNGGKGPALNSTTVAGRHWYLLQHLKKVFLTFCPADQVPPFIVNSVMRLFRYIFIHTRDGNPYGMHFEDQAQDSRIKSALEACIAQERKFAFNYEAIKNKSECRIDSSFVMEDIDDPTPGVPAGSKISVKKWSNVSLCKCDTELSWLNTTYPVMLLNGTSAGTITDDATPLNFTKPIISLPETQKHMIIGKNFTVGKHDFIVETIWKIINFGHFYCSRQFETYPEDHSALFDKMESLFNKDIIFRWTHPGNKSAALWKAFYNVYDLNKFVESLDACVGGAKEISDYPNWLTRPTKQSRTKREVENPVLWNGNGFCMRDQWEPLDHLGLDIPKECREGRTLFR